MLTEHIARTLSSNTVINLKEYVRVISVMLIEESITVLQNNLPPKSNNQESFTISYTIGNSHFDKVLCDLGKYINLMFFSIFKKLGLGDVKPTAISLQLVDRSIKHPRCFI